MRLLYFQAEQAARLALASVNLEQLEVRYLTMEPGPARAALAVKLADLSTVQRQS